MFPREEDRRHSIRSRNTKAKTSWYSPGLVSSRSSPGRPPVLSWSSLPPPGCPLVTGAASYWGTGGGGLGAGRSVRGCDCLPGGRSGCGCLALGTLEKINKIYFTELKPAQTGKIIPVLLINLIDFCKCMLILNVMCATRSESVGTEAA